MSPATLISTHRSFRRLQLIGCKDGESCQSATSVEVCGWATRLADFVILYTTLMNNSSDTPKKNNMSIGQLLGWGLGIFFGLGGIGLLSTEPIVGVGLIVMAAFLIPPICKAIESSMNIQLSTGKRVMIIALLLVIASSFKIPEQEKKIVLPEQTEPETQEIEVKEDAEVKVIDYEIIKDNDVSYAGCKRREYKLLIKDDATQDEVRNVLEKVYNDKKDLSDKTVIYSYRTSDKAKVDEILYQGRLFMSPDCDDSNDYEIDFAYWNLDLEGASEKPSWYEKELVIDSSEFEHMATKVINLWASYEDRSKPVGTLSKGDVVKIIGYDAENDYCKIKKETLIGWTACGWIKDLPKDMSDSWEQ